jgi:hypothetical protein
LPEKLNCNATDIEDTACCGWTFVLYQAASVAIKLTIANIRLHFQYRQNVRNDINMAESDEKTSSPRQQETPNPHTVTDTNSRPGLFSVLQSVLAAMFGVQSEEKRQLDFEKGHPAEYIFVGIIMVVLFILTIIWVVNSAIADYQAGG